MKYIKEKFNAWKLRELMKYAEQNNLHLVQFGYVGKAEYLKMRDGSLRRLSRR